MLTIDALHEIIRETAKNTNISLSISPQPDFVKITPTEVGKYPVGTWIGDAIASTHMNILIQMVGFALSRVGFHLSSVNMTKSMRNVSYGKDDTVVSCSYRERTDDPQIPSIIYTISKR